MSSLNSQVLFEIYHMKLNMSSAGGFHDGNEGTRANCVAHFSSLWKTMEVCGKKFMFVS